MNNGNFEYLKSEQYYNDLYDRHTAEQCRRLISIHSKPLKKQPLFNGKKPSKKMVEITSKMTLDLALLFEKGERYIDKEGIVSKWMRQDEAKDEFYESVVPPTDIQCLKCQSKMNLLDKDLHTQGLNEPDRVLFMFNCPNGCLPRRAFYDNGEEWKPNLSICPKCNKVLEVKDEKIKDKLITQYRCASCGFIKTDELDYIINIKEDVDPNFESDRILFCLSKEKGEKWRQERIRLEQMGKLVDSWKEKDRNKELYDRVAKLKRLTVIELEKYLTPILKKEGYIHFKLLDPEIGKNVIVSFTIQDSKSEREHRTSEYDLRSFLKKSLNDTNWRLMSDGVSYRLGVLSGRVRGYERDEDLIKLIK